jgi:hypothetical protein
MEREDRRQGQTFPELPVLLGVRGAEKPKRAAGLDFGPGEPIDRQARQVPSFFLRVP